MKIKILPIIVIVIFLTSCGLFKKGVDNKEIVKKEIPKPDENVIDMTKKLKEKYPDYKYLEIKFSAKYKSKNKNLPIRGIIKINRDSCIWVSIRPGLGIELARLLLTKDSVKFIDRMKTEYFIGDYKYFENQLNIKLDYKIIQAILTNEFFIYPAENDFVSDLVNFKLLEEKGKKILLKKNILNNDTVMQKISIRSNEVKIFEVISEMSKQKRKLKIEYTDFQKLNNKSLPKNIMTKITENNEKLILDLTYNNIKTDKKFKPTFRISKRYKKIELGKN